MNADRSTSTLTGRRILVGPNDIAGFASRIAVALAGGGADVLFFNGQDHAFNPHVAESENLHRLFGRAIGVASRWRAKGGLVAVAGGALAGIVKLLAFVKACVWAQTIVMIGGKGFFGGACEYAFLRLLGKRVVHVFVGTASRPRYQSGYAKNVLKGGTVNQKELKRLAKRTRRQAARIRGISRNATLVIENPLCGHFHEKAFVNLFKLGIPLDVAALAKKPRLSENTPPRAEGKIRVLHCPSRPEIKGSARIQTVVEKLICEGVPIEFRQLTGVPHAQVLHEITVSDFVVDQLYSDSPMAGFAAEASAFGKAAVVGGYGWKLFGEYLRPEEIPPTATCHPDELEKLIRALALDSVRRDELGAQARTFLQSQWSEASFAERFARVVTGDIPPDWLVQPAQVAYLHGAGMEESEVRRLVAALVSQFGSKALQLDHLPKLRDSLTSAARSL
ncbi:MAG: hypothetical protein EXS35_05515 [Pedosphaera sp.]|nr:hypothetical protein [Pedosphaera sp.]